ncbi:MAG TPA: sigma-70 family RNA polymerase sigma factor [Acidimicrobiales bacterium]
MDGAELVSRAVQGDEAAFELLVRRHAAAAWRLAHTLLRDDFAAEEAVQDAFVKAHRALPTFRGDAAFSTWLLAITRRVCLDRLRLKRANIVPLDEARRVKAEVGDAALRVVLERAIAELPDAEREAFTLVDVLGYSREDAAAVVGVPPSTMRSRVARARERLAAALGDDLRAAL